MLHFSIFKRTEFGYKQLTTTHYVSTNKIIHVYFSHMTYFMSHVTSINNTCGCSYKLPHSGLQQMGYKLICSQTLSLKESFKIKTNQSYIRSTVLKESFKTKIEYYVKIYNRIWLMTSIFQSSRVRLFFQFILRGYCQFFILSYLEREECNLLKNIYLIQINIYSILTKYQ